MVSTPRSLAQRAQRLDLRGHAVGDSQHLRTVLGQAGDAVAGAGEVFEPQLAFQ
jgi:hypothetical protein